MIALSLFVFLIVTILVKYFLHMRHMESYVKHLPMKRPFIPFIGNVHYLIGKTATEMLKEIMEFTKLTGTPHKSYVGPTLAITIDNPEDVKTVLTSPYCVCKPYVYHFYPSPDGILTARCKQFLRLF